MSAMTATLLTADDYIATGDTRPRWTELINGEVIVNSPTFRHQAAVSYIHYRLMDWTLNGPNRGTTPGQLDFKFDNGNVLAPDVTWISGEISLDAAVQNFSPDLAVEVRSPSTWRYDTTVKFRIYEAAGVAEVWLVDSPMLAGPNSASLRDPPGRPFQPASRIGDCASKSVLVYRRSTPTHPDFDIALELSEGETLETPLLPDFSLNITALFSHPNS